MDRRLQISFGKEDQRAQGVANSRHLGPHHRKERTETADQPLPRPARENLQAKYWKTNQRVTKSTRADKRKCIHYLTEAETAAGKRDMKRLYEITRTLAGRSTQPTCSVKDKEGRIIINECQERARWAENFKETLNRPPPEQPPPIFPADSLLNGKLQRKTYRTL